MGNKRIREEEKSRLKSVYRTQIDINMNSALHEGQGGEFRASFTSMTLKSFRREVKMHFSLRSVRGWKKV